MQDPLQLQREKVDQHIRLENAHQWQAVQETFTATGNAFFDLVPFSARLPGLAGVTQAYEILSTALPDVTIRVNSAYDVPGCSIRELTVSGTHQGDYSGAPPLGKRVSIEMACFFLFGMGEDEGQLIAERVYFDNETLLRQMRGEENAPTGIGL